MKLWIGQHVHVSGRSDVVFIKLHTHGTQEGNLDYFFNNNGLDNLFTQLESYCKGIGGDLYYVSSRQMYNVVKGLELNPDARIKNILNHGLEVSF